ncbi:MAG TPA: tRNA (adenosine(37)-N6)-threonylcarbamoyltransferase complex ATPase subunit type 1 TsaE [Nevskiaceae bacterium]|nr:tRNA (adenosine(37)-N6)-threonylcarbamoyltransferase complex ATPase subunit type 1 TsaE [Nevskiaceae bacterium]
MLTLQLPDAAATETLGAAIAHALQTYPGAVIYLEGDLGAGKTTLARGFLHQLGVTGAVRSPTYTLLEHYTAGERRVLHMDLYRLSDPLELGNLGLADFPYGSTYWLIEWPRRGGALLPPAVITVRLAQLGSRRLAVVEANQVFGRDFDQDVEEFLRQRTKNQP